MKVNGLDLLLLWTTRYIRASGSTCWIHW